MQEEGVEQIHKLCKENQGPCQLVLHLSLDDYKSPQVLAGDIRVSSNSGFTDELEKITGKGNVWISDKEPSFAYS